MIKFFNPENKQYECIVGNAILPENLENFEKWVSENRSEIKSAEVITDVENENTKKSIRDSAIAWIPHDELTSGFYDNITRVALDVNNQKFNFNLQYLEMLQYGEYSVDGHYDWHADGVLRSDNNDARKLSFSLLISDDDEYEGGELEFYGPSGVYNYKPKRNEAVFFPSFLLHRVAPVTSGLRKSVVGWIHGPDFV